MGQQQLLLLVMGVVIVGFAVTAGMVAWEDAARQHTADNLVERNLSIAANAIVWKTRTDPYRGGSADYADLSDGGMAELFMGQTTPNGCFRFTYADGDSLVISARSLTYPDTGVRTHVKDNYVHSTLIQHDGSIDIDCAG